MFTSLQHKFPLKARRQGHLLLPTAPCRRCNFNLSLVLWPLCDVVTVWLCVLAVHGATSSTRTRRRCCNALYSHSGCVECF